MVSTGSSLQAVWQSQPRDTTRISKKVNASSWRLIATTLALTSLGSALVPKLSVRTRLRHVQRQVIPKYAESMLRIPKRPPKKRVPQTISEGRRLVKIESLMDVAESMKEVKYAEVRAGGAQLDPKQKRRPKFRTFLQQSQTEEFEGAYGQITELGGQIARWLPDVLSGNRVWKEPLVAEDLAMLFDAFEPDLDTELAPVVEYALRVAFKTTTLQEITIILEAMATARLSYDESYKVVGQVGSSYCVDAPEDEVAEFGFALAFASQRISKQCYLQLKEGLETNVRSIPGKQVRLLGWAAAEAGSPLPELLGSAPGNVDSDLAEHVWQSCSILAAEAENQLLSGWPLPVVEVTQLLPQDQLQSLVDLANSNDLWRPSARKGGSGEDAGRPIEGFPWTALLTSSNHGSNPAAMDLRHWVAKAFQAPVAHVEAIRLIRYRPGEAPKTAKSDLRPPEDNSLWLSGQRLVTVMLQLNDLSEQGGATFFPNLNEGQGMKMALQAGSALIWPTVDRDGQATDLTQRMALPTTDTVKYVAVTWLRAGPAPGEAGGAPA